MEDLVPLIFFLIIVAVNVLKFFIEKGGKAKKAPAQNRETPPKRTSPLESFFEDLAQQMAPKPTELADWPEGRERPDYTREMEEFQQAEEFEEEQTAEIIPMPTPAPAASRIRNPEKPEFQPLENPAVVQPPLQATKAILSGAQGIRMPCMNPFNHNGAAGHTGFRIKGKKDLRRAMLSHIVFSSPRALDLSFNDTIAK